MNLVESQKNWDALAREDPLFAILTYKDKQGGKWDARDFFETGRAEVAADMAYMRSVGVSSDPPRRALDFGCGAGRLTQALADHCGAVEGVDISPEMIRLARSYNQKGERCGFSAHARHDLGLFADNSFDMAYSKITLQHIRPRWCLAYLKEFMRVLRPGGVLFFQLTGEPAKPAPYHPFRRLARSMLPGPVREWMRDVKYASRPRVDVYGIPRRKVVKILEENGARILGIRRNDAAGAYWTGYDYCAVKNG